MVVYKLIDHFKLLTRTASASTEFSSPVPRASALNTLSPIFVTHQRRVDSFITESANNVKQSGVIEYSNMKVRGLGDFN